MSSENLKIPPIGIPEITAINFRATQSRLRPRLNLLVPSIAAEHRFGGINTALDFFFALTACAKDYETRILLTDAGLVEKLDNEFSKYQVCRMDEEADAKHQIVALNDRAFKTLSVASNDIFVATAWWTAYCAIDLIKQQSTAFSTNLPLLYLIQDFEPGFYQWSARYDAALSTYRSSVPTMAIFNSSLLRDYFKMQGLNFLKEEFFEPRLNRRLKAYWEKGLQPDKKKKMLVYGRPSTPRNAFDAAIQAVNIWKDIYPNAGEWEIVSLGEKHADIPLGCVTVKSHGKVALDEYARHLLNAAVGLSLMVSPHPSYPPLEMAHFGCLTVTNDFANKKWAGLHENFFSINSATPNDIAKRLREACEQYEEKPGCGWRGKSHLNYYLSDNSQFNFIEKMAAYISDAFSQNRSPDMAIRDID